MAGQMQRPHFRPPFPGQSPRMGGFRSPPPAMERGPGLLPSPPWAFQSPPHQFGPRYGPYGGSPNTPPRDFSANRGGSNGKYSGRSPGHTPRRPGNNRSPYYHSPGQHGGPFQVETLPVDTLYEQKYWDMSVCQDIG